MNKKRHAIRWNSSYRIGCEEGEIMRHGVGRARRRVEQEEVVQKPF